MNAIAAQVGRNRRTVNKYMQASPWPERPPRRRRHPTGLDPDNADLLERGNAGCRHALARCRARQSPGLQGTDRVVAAYVSRFRAAPRRVSTPRDAGGAATIGEADQPRTPRVATWLVRRREEKLTDDEKQQLAALPAQEGDRAEAIARTQDVAALGRQRQPAQLDTWRDRAAARGLQSFKSGATGLRED